MAYENVRRGGITGVTASANLTGSQFLFASIDGEKAVGVAGNGVSADGVIQNKPDAWQAFALAMAGDTSNVLAGAAVAAGDEVMSNASGEGITLAGSGSVSQGKCLTAVANAGELMTVQLSTSPGKVP